MGFSVCTMAYGDFPDLLRKTLTSVLETYKPGQVTDLRIGLNEVGQATKDLVMDMCGNNFLDVPCYVYEPTHNVGKYPLMRRMFYDEKRPIDRLLMWFDDDTYLDKDANTTWWAEVEQTMQNAVVLGAVHQLTQRGNQWRGIQAQPWYNQRKVDANHRFSFATGGWWAARSEFITKWDYPFPEIHHNGGDSILGELLRQQGLSPTKFDRVRCYCESCERKQLPHQPGVVHLNVGGRKGRRGIGRSREVYPWQINNGQSGDHTFHNFSTKIYRYDRGA